MLVDEDIDHLHALAGTFMQGIQARRLGACGEECLAGRVEHQLAKIGRSCFIIRRGHHLGDQCTQHHSHRVARLELARNIKIDLAVRIHQLPGQMQRQVIGEVPAEIEGRRSRRVDKNAFADIEDILLAGMFHPADTLQLQDQEQVLVGVAANVIPIAVDVIEIVGDMGELHAADIDATCRADDLVAALHQMRIEAAANVLKIVRPLLVGRRRPGPVNQAAVLQQVQLRLPTVSALRKTATDPLTRQSNT